MTSRPPNYVNVPAAVAYAPVPDALVVTMLRILGLCWTNRYRHTPPLTTGELTRLLDRPRSTLQRHLDLLEQELGWLRREHRDGRFVLHPCPPFSAHPVPEDPDPSPGASVVGETLGAPRSKAPGASVAGETLGAARSTAPGASVVGETLGAARSNSRGTSVAVEASGTAVVRETLGAARSTASGTAVAVEALGAARSKAPGTSVAGQAPGTACSTTPGAFVVAEPAGNGRGSAKSASGAPHTSVAGENGKSRNGSVHTALAPNHGGSPLPEVLAGKQDLSQAKADVGIENPAREPHLVAAKQSPTGHADIGARGTKWTKGGRRGHLLSGY